MKNRQKEVDALVHAAFAWWDSKNPIGWNLRMHLEHPDINCTSHAERDLAEAVADIARNN